ncbi:18211_t:CDS:2, partial [Racocetra fulgida]
INKNNPAIEATIYEINTESNNSNFECCMTIYENDLELIEATEDVVTNSIEPVLENGFAFTITHSELDKLDEISRRHTYKYMKGQLYVLKKKAHNIKKCNRDHHS